MTRITAFASLCATGFFARLSYSLARTPVLPLFAMYLGAGPETIGLTVGISTVTGIFFKLPSGAMSDVIGRRKTMLIGLLVFAAMPFMYLMVKDAFLLIIIRFFHGFATAIYGPVSMAYVADSAGDKRGEMLSWFSSITIIGNLLGAPLGGYMLHGGLGTSEPLLREFHAAYFISGLSGAMALLMAVLFIRDSTDEARPAFNLRESFIKLKRGVMEVVKDKRIIAVSNMEGLQNMSMGALEAFLPIYGVSIGGLNELEAGVLWGVQVLVTILSKPMMGRMSDRSGRKSIIIIGMFLCALSFGAIPHLRGFWPLMAASAMFGFGEAFVTSSSAALVADLCRQRNFGAAMGAFGTIFDMGHAAGPIMAGVLIANLGYSSSFLIIAGLLILSVPVFGAVLRDEK